MILNSQNVISARTQRQRDKASLGTNSLPWVTTPDSGQSHPLGPQTGLSSKGLGSCQNAAVLACRRKTTRGAHGLGMEKGGARLFQEGGQQFPLTGDLFRCGGHRTEEEPGGFHFNG